MRSLLLTLSLLLVACPGEPVEAPDDDDDSATPSPEEPTAEPAPEPSPEPTPPPYTGPSYLPCVTDAQCDPGDACTSVPGHSGAYCAPACDPTGHGAECARPDLPFEVACMANGRCARGCGVDEAPGAPSQQGADDYGLCPETVFCQEVNDQPVCAGELFGPAGYYGVCTHPFADGADCPADSQCLGGDLVGLDDLGLCLPECPEQTCPTPPSDTSNATPICYDIGYEVPLCALLCVVDDPDTACPEAQVCNDFGFVGICAPDGVESPL